MAYDDNLIEDCDNNNEEKEQLANCLDVDTDDDDQMSIISDILNEDEDEGDLKELEFGGN